MISVSVSCVSSSALEVEVRDCVPDALVYVVNCTIRTCTTSNLTFTVDTVSDCDPDLDSDSNNVSKHIDTFYGAKYLLID